LQTELFAALPWSHQFNSDWSIKQQIAYDNTVVNNSSTVPESVVFPAVQRDSLQLQVPQTTYSTIVDITGHINNFGAEHTLLLGGDVYRLTGFDSMSIYAFTTIGLSNSIHLGIPSPVLPTSFCPCYNATAFTQDTVGLYLQDQIKLPYNFYLLGGRDINMSIKRVQRVSR
jgi:iron complex outermembrane recepter protein